MNCNAVRRAAVSTASKSRPASGPAPVRRSTSAAISAVSMAAKFFSTLPRLAVLIDLRIAQLAVDLDHVPDQRPESMIFGNLPAHPFEGGPGNGSGAGLAIDLAGQRPVRPVSLCTLVRTVAVRLAALDVSGVRLPCRKSPTVASARRRASRLASREPSCAELSMGHSLSAERQAKQSPTIRQIPLF